MKRGCLVVMLAWSLCSAGLAQAAPWSTDTAIPLPEDRWEFGLLHPLHWGVTEGVELSTHPLLTGVMPHVDAKVLWFDDGPLAMATRHGLSYPSLLLNLLSREGAGGLLPPTAEVPEGIVVDSDLLVTITLHEMHWLTVQAGFSVAPRSSGDIPVLDFPFLYPRFAVLNAPVVLHWGLGFEGVVWGQLGYTADVDVWGIDLAIVGYAVEHGLSLTWQINEHVAIAAGYRLSHARYPVGERLHVLPWADVLFGL